MSFIKSNIKFLIAMLIVIVLGVFGITYALKIATFNPIGINTTTGNITASITYDSTNTSTVTSNNKMLPIADTLVTGVDVTDERILKVKFMVTGSSSNPDNTIYDISLRNIDMSNALKSEYVKWRLYKNGTLLSEGNFSPAFDTRENNRLVLTNTQQDLTTNTDTYVYLMWISEACTGDLSTCDITKNQDKLLGKIFNAQIKLEASTKSKKTLTRTALSTNSASMTITNKFTPNKLVENNNVKYRYDTTNNLMEDVDGNIRYYGANPNNYIYFNCSDYNNQTSDTCETWRIIGVFDGKVKIMRGSQIGSYSWDNKNTSTGAENDYGKNDWSTARLMKLLNPSDYYEVDSNDNGNGQSLYWNSQSGTCFAGLNNATKACDFTSTGIKNDTTRNMISESMWYLRGWNSNSVYSDQIYEYERTKGSVYNSTRPTSWKGKIALAYPSDYGYAADLSLCQKKLTSFSHAICTANNWMKTIIAPYYGWLLTPYSGNSYGAGYVYDMGNVQYGINNNYDGTCTATWAVPVLYLGSELDIGSGTGESSSPYQLIVPSYLNNGDSLPSEYQRVEYIGSNGTQYIKTNINCGYNDTVKMVSTGNFNFSSNNELWQGVNAYLQHNFKSSSVSDGNSTLSISDDDTITVSYNGTTHVETLTVGSTGKSISRSWEGNSNYGGNVIFLKMSDKSDIFSTNGITSYLKGAKVYVGETLTLDLIPAVRKKDSVAGMYDIVNGSFYTNSGTGTFTVGNNV